MGKLFNDLKELKSAYDKKLKEEGEAAVKEAFKEVFDKHESIESIYWRQYTPYFNDGDACTFSVHGFCVSFKNDESDTDDYDNETYLLKRSKNPEKKAVEEAVHTLQRELPDDVMESVFGDHCKVTASREGFKIVECDHD